VQACIDHGNRIGRVALEKQRPREIQSRRIGEKQTIEHEEVVNRTAWLTRMLFALVIAAGAGQPRTAPEQGAAAPPVLTSTTRLVQVSVIAKEKGGAPAAGLKVEDFRVQVDVRPQKNQFLLGGIHRREPGGERASGAQHIHEHSGGARAGD
jgi:hypothetical protein